LAVGESSLAVEGGSNKWKRCRGPRGVGTGKRWEEVQKRVYFSKIEFSQSLETGRTPKRNGETKKTKNSEKRQIWGGTRHLRALITALGLMKRKGRKENFD